MIEQEFIGLTILFFFVIIGALIAHKFKQPIGIGLLLIGALIGPHALNLIKNESTLEILTELGTALLLFVIGLEFVIPKLVKTGLKAMVLGLLKIGIVFFICYELLLVTGIDSMTALVIGLCLTISSTVVIVKVLESKGLYNREEMPLLLGILIMEDIFSVLLITFLQKSGSGSMLSTLENVVISLTILSLIYLVMLKVSKYIVAWFIKHSGGEQVIIYIALGLLAGFGALSYFLGLSAATGAFLAGSIVASLPEVKLFEHAIKPYTELFSCIFFVSIGTKVNMASLADNIGFVSFLLLIIIISRFFAVGIIGYLFASFKNDQPIFSSIAMISVGEFSLLIAQIATPMVSNIDLISIIASLIFISAILMSVLISYSDKISKIDSFLPYEFMEKPRSMSNYIKSLFAEMEIENAHTKELKHKVFHLMVTGTLFLLTIISWRKIIAGDIAVEGFILIMLHVLCIGLISLFGYHAYKNSTGTYKILVDLLMLANPSATQRGCKYVLNNFFVVMFLFMIAIFSPMFMALAGISKWYNIISFLLIIVCMVRLKKMTKVIHSTVKKKIMVKGWEFD